MARTRSIGRVLIAALAQTDADGTVRQPAITDIVRGADLRGLPAAAAFHGVVGFVHHALGGGSPVDENVAAAVRAAYHKAILTHLQALQDLAQLAPALDSLGIPWLVIKGPVLAEDVYPRPDLRGYTDLDLVVPGTHLSQALKVMDGLGVRTVDHDWNNLREHMDAEVPLVSPRGTLVDLHWHLLNWERYRREFDIPMAQLFERARRVELPGCTVRTLDPVDTLIHLGLHGCLSGAHRLVWLKDVDQSIKRGPVAWDVLVQRCRAFGVGLPVASMFETTVAVLDTPIPGDVISDLARSQAWRSVLAVARRMRPVEQNTGRRSPVQLVARSTRHDARTSAMQLLQNVEHSLRHRLGLVKSDNVIPGAGTPDEYLAAVAAEIAEDVRGR